MILIAFHISHSLNTKRHAGSEKTYSKNLRSKCTNLDQSIMKRLHNIPTKKTYPHLIQIAEKQDFEGKSLCFNHRISFDTKGPISPSSEGNSFIMIVVDAFRHYVALNPVPHCNAHYAYTTILMTFGMQNLDYRKSLSQIMALSSLVMK